ncbi:MULTISPECIES: NAD(P)H-hydrate epimerase [Eikenella]|uniref:NAD(P)H-hydrate epimerase n=1 Tax=Eikenella TaxID=538 RepID=UPI0007E061B0|nr:MULTISPECIES: NAD(P)H-hydrate epimerase [Eikenella]OAM39724.1 NAD(P)H-hydrate epimerase [Eikenella sp. NML120348]OAM45802.1 NAD(P)H-hydrate epimerase [Eikenella sp. NML99-0057]
MPQNTPKIYTAAQMREREQAAVEAGTSFLQLMENAGQAAAADLLRRLPEPGRALLVCGKGNNGGDALVIARVLQQHGWQADIVLLLGAILSDLAETNRQRLQGLDGIRFLPAEALPAELEQGYSLIIDGIFGTGFSGSLPPEAAECCRQINRAVGYKVALDIPTGLNGDTGEAADDTFRANLTYAFAALKPAHAGPTAQQWCGEIVCLDIGID